MATTRGKELTDIDLHTGGTTRYQVYMDKARNMTASTMLLVEVDEKNTDHNKATVPVSPAGGTRGSAQQAWGNRSETNPQQMQKNRNSGQQGVSHICINWTNSDFQERLDDNQ